MKTSICISFFFLVAACQNHQNQVLNANFTISQDGINSDTLIFLRNNKVEYIHTGIGINFSGNFYFENKMIIVDILDFKNQVLKNSEKEVVLQFTIMEKESEYEFYKINKNNPLFDKVKRSSQVRLIKN